MKYYNSMVVFEEIPNEITLAINITNCPCKCDRCHSKFLWGDVGTELTTDELNEIIKKNGGITTVCIMGGDREPEKVNEIARYIKEKVKLKSGWYSGMDELSDRVDICNFDFIKIGHYDKEFGALNKRTTNQRFYTVEGNELVDRTYLFWKN